MIIDYLFESRIFTPIKEMCDYLDVIVEPDKIELVKKGIVRLMIVLYLTGLIFGLIIGVIVVIV